MSAFNLDQFAGLARTEYVLDASCVSSTTLSGMVVNSGGATHTLDSIMNVAGGRITLSAGTSGAKNVLTLPVTFGNAGGSLRAWLIEVEGLYCQTARSIFRVYAGNPSESLYSGVRWDAEGALVVSSTGAALPEKNQMAKIGNFSLLDNTATAFLVDYPLGAPSKSSLQGHFGYSQVGVGGEVGVRGTLMVRMTNEATATNPSSAVGFRQLKLTCIWGTPGDTVTKVY